MRWPEVMLRMALIIGLLAANAYSATVWIIAPLGLLAISATAELAVRPYATNAADRLLLGCGAVVTVFILVGLGLNLTPWGLTRTTWNVAWLVGSIGILIWRRRLSTGIGLPTTRIGAPSVWMISAAVILAAAVAVSIAGIRHSNKQAVLAFSVVSRGPDSVMVEIDATSVSGQYQITASSNNKRAHRYFSPLLKISAANSSKRIRERVPVNVAGIWTINLQSAVNNQTLRQLKIYLN
jgi:hypothetical protein